MIALFEKRYDDVIVHTRRVIDSGFADPEVFYHWAGALALAGDHDGALNLLERAIDGGFHPASAMARDWRLEPLRTAPDFSQIVRRAETLQDHAFETFRGAGGPRLLGLPE